MPGGSSSRVFYGLIVLTSSFAALIAAGDVARRLDVVTVDNWADLKTQCESSAANSVEGVVRREFSLAKSFVGDAASYPGPIILGNAGNTGISRHCVIRGNGKTLDAGSAGHIFSVNGAKSVLEVYSLTLKNGKAQIRYENLGSATSPIWVQRESGTGGAIQAGAAGCIVELHDITFQANYADKKGGAIYNNGAEVRIYASTFDGNGQNSCSVRPASGQTCEASWESNDQEAIYATHGIVVFKGCTSSGEIADITMETRTTLPSGISSLLSCPTEAPTVAPTDAPTDAPTEAPTDAPTETPTNPPTDATNGAVTTSSISGFATISGFESVAALPRTSLHSGMF
jgi:predicted outer membrane repeat protein